MSLWWLQPGWTNTTCAQCGRTIWPEGDPDWGLCFDCFSNHVAEQRQQEPPRIPCDVCETGDACALCNGFQVCSQACDDIACADGLGLS